MIQINGDFKVSQVLNNNVVSAIDSNGRELILTGKGIGFKAAPGAAIDTAHADKIFLLKEDDAASSHLKSLMENLPLEIVQLTDFIVESAKTSLNRSFSDSLFIALADHLDFALKRAQKGIVINNPLEWEIKNYYESEYNFASSILESVLVKFGILFDKGEACSIALHIINADNSNIHEFKNITKIVFQIVNIVKYVFKIDINEKTHNYQRFIRHLKFFAQRITKKEVINNHDSLYSEVLLNNVSKTNECVETIAEFIRKNYQHSMSDSEKLYLVIHIDNVVKDNV